MGSRSLYVYNSIVLCLVVLTLPGLSANGIHDNNITSSINDNSIALLPQDSKTDIDEGFGNSHHGLRNEYIDKKPDYMDVAQYPCEAGHPCEKDHWCSPSRQVCRPCRDIIAWCNQTNVIHSRYATCEDFCYRQQIDATRRCEAEKEVVEANLRLKETELENQTTNAETDRKTCADEISRLEQERKAQDETIKKLKCEKDDQEKEKEKAAMEKDRIITALAVGLAITMLWAVGVTGCYLFMGTRRKERRQMQDAEGQQGPQQPTNDNAKTPFLSTPEVKTSVQADGRDKGEYHGNQGRPGARVPGDSSISC